MEPITKPSLFLQVTLAGESGLPVRKGDRYGFTWEALAGFVTYDTIDNTNRSVPFQFCEDTVVARPGDVVVLAEGRHALRFYSVMLHVKPDCGAHIHGVCSACCT
jgi:hypothetical protein